MDAREDVQMAGKEDRVAYAGRVPGGVIFPGAPRRRFSTIVATRNDDHGRRLTERSNAFVRVLAEQCDRLECSMELVIVEWNPPADRAPIVEELTWPDTDMSIRVITVSKEIHDEVNRSELPFLQMLAKNAGLRRTRADFPIMTCIDCLYHDGIVEWLADAVIDPAYYYRAPRHDIRSGAVPRIAGEELMQFCKASEWRWHRRVPHADVFANASGDFTMASKGAWFAIRGYEEHADKWSLHLDTLSLYMLVASGLQEAVLPWPVFHMRHAEGWEKPEWALTPYPAIDYQADAVEAGQRMVKAGEVTLFNDEDWGLASYDLPEVVL